MNCDFSAKILNTLASFLLIFAILLTSFEFVCYGMQNWWEKEYTKHNTLRYINGEMTLDDATDVTKDMLEYCAGRRDSASDIEATLDGVRQPFFNERELKHLADVRALVMRSLTLRNVIVLLYAFYIAAMLIKKRRQAVAGGFLSASAVFLVIAVIIGIAALVNFDAIFVKFHELLFSNDYWILYPMKDNLINLMREDIFVDMFTLAGLIWAGIVAVVAAICKGYLASELHS